MFRSLHSFTWTRCHAIAAAMIVGVGTAIPRVATSQESPPRPSADTLGLSLHDAQMGVLRRNPAFLADRQEVPIAEGQLRQASAYQYNPELSGMAPGLTSTGAVGEYEVSLIQEVEWAGQWGLRSTAATLGLDRATASVRDAVRLAIREVSRAYFEALTAERRYIVYSAVADLNGRLVAATRVQLREGEISALESNLAEIEFGRARAGVLAARRVSTAAALELKRLVGIAPQQPIRLIDDLSSMPVSGALSPDSLLATALSRRPDLAADSAFIGQSETLRLLAGREAVPNLRLGLVATRDRAGQASQLGVVVGLAIPVWNRNQGLVAQREAEREQARLRRDATELRVRSQVAIAHAAYVAASEEAEVYESSVLQPARANQQLLETAYRSGKVGLPTLLLLRNQLLAAELGYWDAWLARRAALIDLESATGSLAATISDTGITP